MNNQLYIVLINYNTHLDTIECLESIYKNDIDDRLQIIMVDNSEEKFEIEAIINWAEGKTLNPIETKFPEFVLPVATKPLDYVLVDQDDLIKNQYNQNLILVKARENRGFAGANNIGLNYIQQFGKTGDMIWLLNSDTVIAPDTIDYLYKELGVFDKKINETLFGTPLLEYDKPNIIQAIGGKYNEVFAITSHVGEGLSINEKIDLDSVMVDYPIGASMILSYEFLNKVGLMNEEYFLFFEELDWVQRAKKFGGEVRILPVFGVYHKQGGATKHKTKGIRSKFMDLLTIKNRIIVTKNHFENRVWSVKLFIFTVTVFKRIISGNFDRIPKIIKLVFIT